jgi:hypothetical protein
MGDEPILERIVSRPQEKQSTMNKGLYLRLDLLKPLDVVLANSKQRGHWLIPASIQAATLGRFSHAALVSDDTSWFEADAAGL